MKKKGHLQPFRITGGLIVCILILITQPSFSQTIEEVKQRWRVEKNNPSGNFNDEASFIMATFTSIVQTRDDEFSEYLTEPWPLLTVSQGTKFPKSTSGNQQPVFYLDETTLNAPKPIAYQSPGENWTGKNVQDIFPPRIVTSQRQGSTLALAKLTFYGTDAFVPYEPLLAAIEINGERDEKVRSFWQSFTAVNCNPTISYLQSFSTKLGLDDWGYMRLIRSFGSALYPQSTDKARMVAWALMLRSGYQVKIGIHQKGFVILFASRSAIYSQPFVRSNGTVYYIDEVIPDIQLHCYANNLQGSDKPLALESRKSLHFNPATTPVKVNFHWGASPYEFTFRYSTSIAQYLADRPKCEARNAFTASASVQLKESIFRQLNPVLSTMREPEAVAFLQQLVQTGFAYRAYNDLYGHDKYLEPDEFLASDGTNDRGHALFFSWLVRYLMNLPVAIVESNGYYSVAVAFSEQVDGDYFEVDGVRYIIADPTCQMAPIGLVIPQIANQKPVLYPLEAPREAERAIKRTWQMAQSLGARRSGSANDLIKDNLGNQYLTGHFASAQGAIPFLACFNKNSSLQWIRKFTVNRGQSYGLSIEKSVQNEIYLSGVFKGEIELDGKILMAQNDNPDLFFAQFNQDGDLIWLKKGGLDQLEKELPLAYFAKFDRSGNNFYLQLSNEDNRNITSGFCGSDQNWIYFKGSCELTTAMQRFSYRDNKNMITYFDRELSQTENTYTENRIKGVTAFFKLLAENGTTVTGNQIKEMVSRNDPARNVQSPAINSWLDKISSVQNRNGLITISTIDGLPLAIAPFRFSQNSSFIIIPNANGEFSVRVVTGGTYHKFPFSSIINQIDFDNRTGEAVVDFGIEHTIQRISILHDTVNQ